MKIQINKLWLAALPLAFVACQNEDVLESAQPVQQKTPVKALVGNLPTEHTSRAQIQLGCQDDYTEYFQWNAGDSFAMYYANQENDPYNPAVFQIDSSYSDDAPSANANFSTDYEGFYAGDEVVAMYPVPNVQDGSDCVERAVGSSEMVDGSDEEWRAYFAKNMHMRATTTLEEGGQQLQFEHETYIIRLTYTNNTEETQDITSVQVRANNYWFTVKRDFNIRYQHIDSSYGESYMRHGFSDLKVPAGEKKDFYFIVFGDNRDWGYDDASLTIMIFTVDNPMAETVFPLPLSAIAKANGGVNRFEAGKRYWFNVTQTGNDLDWDFADLGIEVPTGTITNLPLIQALENRNGLQFNKDAQGFVDVSDWQNYKQIYKTTYLDLGWNSELTSLEGLEYFMNLEELGVEGLGLTSLDVSPFGELRYLHCQNNQLTSLDVSNNPKLSGLYVGSNLLTSIDVSNNLELWRLYVSDNKLTQLDLSGTSVDDLDCSYNELTSLDLSYRTDAMNALFCNNNHISALNISHMYYNEEEGGWFDFYCGQQTDKDGNPMDITLTLRGEDDPSDDWWLKSQLPLWEKFADDERNNGVVLNTGNAGGGIVEAE